MQGCTRAPGSDILPPMRGVWIEARHVGRAYGRREVLKDLNFRAESGELWAVLGPNGSGKSTLLKILSGLLRPTRGQTVLCVDGREMKGPERRVALGQVSPDISAYEELTGLENLEFCARLRGLPRDRNSLMEQLRAVGLEEAADRAAREYSSGMRQRLKLAMAVQHHPALLILDEPTALLDEEGRGRVHAVVSGHRAHGIVIWATNEPAELPADCRELRLPQ